MKIITENETETIDVGRKLGRAITQGIVIALYGDLGVGKTHFISGIADGLGYTGETYSPTFALVNEYIGGRIPMYHFDMYRVSGWDDLYTTGFFDYIDEGGVLAVEWSENIEAALPDDCIRVTLTRTGDTERIIEIIGGDESIYENFGT